jgi:sarcosine oxidase subunit beta
MDVVIIGAGVVGTSIALELARTGREVIVLDRGGGPGLGSASASSAIVRFRYSTFEGIAVASKPGSAGRTGLITWV